MENKSGFSSRLGFVLAAAGSAVGLGNLWRFPYLAAKYGGGIFLLVYLILAVTFGFTLMLTEITIGRKTGKSCVDAFGMLNKKFSFIGYLAALVPIIIFPYYCVIGGWVTKFLTLFATGGGKSSVGPRKTCAGSYAQYQEEIRKKCCTEGNESSERCNRHGQKRTDRRTQSIKRGVT